MCTEHHRGEPRRWGRLVEILRNRSVHGLSNDGDRVWRRCGPVAVGVLEEQERMSIGVAGATATPQAGLRPDRMSATSDRRA